MSFCFPHTQNAVLKNITYFYAFGNTPAKNLLEQYPLVSDTQVDLLLLGCGDVRHLLFTLKCSSELRQARNLSFTMVDIEPAVLARNILILTLMGRLPKTEPEKLPYLASLWSIYYNFRCSKAQLELVNGAVEYLLAPGPDVENFHSSKIGQIFRFSSHDTYHKVRMLWSKYRDASVVCNGTTSINPQIFNTAVEKVKQKMVTGFVLGSARRYLLSMSQLISTSASPTVVEHITHAANIFKKYWQKGSLDGNVEPFPNPLLYYTYNNHFFNLHYGQNPLDGYHLALAYMDLDTKNTSGFTNLKNSPKGALAAAQHEFNEWARTFAQIYQNLEDGNTNGTKLRIYNCHADAMDFAWALGSLQKEEPRPIHLGICGFNFRPFIFTNDYFPDKSVKAPIHFDVIDTSNLGDHVGLLNLLLATSSLLKPITSSSLSTDLLVSARCGSITDVITKATGVDYPLLASILGLSVSSNLIPWNTSSIVFDNVLQEIISSDQRYYNITWKIPLQLDPTAQSIVNSPFALSMDEASLTEVIVGLYRHLFEEKAHKLLSGKVDYDPTELMRFKDASRAGFARAVAYLLSALGVDTKRRHQVGEKVHDRLQGLGHMMFYHNYQELLVWLHVYDILPAPHLADGPGELHKIHKHTPMVPSGGIDFDTSPAMFRAVLVVPRSVVNQKLVVSGLEPNALVTPELCVQIFVNGGQSFFEVLKCFLAKPVLRKSVASIPDDKWTLECEDFILVEEDQDGLYGSGDLVLTFLINATILLQAPPENVGVSLGLSQSFRNTTFIGKAGISFDLMLYKTTFADKKHVSLVCASPTNEPLRATSSKPNYRNGIQKLLPFAHPSSRSIPASTQASSGDVESATTQISLVDGTRLSSFVTRITLRQKVLQAHLADPKTTVNVQQDSPCTIGISLKGVKQTITKYLGFPVPVNVNTARIKFSRKSFLIEVAVSPLSYNPDYPQLPIQFKSVVRDVQHDTLTLPGFSRLPLHMLPPVHPIKNNWLYTSVAQSFSAYDKKCLRPGEVGLVAPPTPPTPLMNFKESLHTMGMHFIGQGYTPGKSLHRFGISDQEKDIQVLCHLESMRLDTAAGSIVYDLCVCPLVESIVSTVALPFHELGDLVTIFMDKEELVLFKNLLPALVERCRIPAGSILPDGAQGYNHTAACAYRKAIPVSTAYGKTPLCSCGAGKMLTKAMVDAVGGKNCARYWYRCAFSVLFPHPGASTPKIPKSDEPMQKPAPTPKNNNPVPQRRQSPAPSSSPTASKACARCGTKEGKLLKCSRCTKVYYCGAACQRADWKEHKTTCK